MPGVTVRIGAGPSLPFCGGSGVPADNEFPTCVDAHLGPRARAFAGFISFWQQLFLPRHVNNVALVLIKFNLSTAGRSEAALRFAEARSRDRPPPRRIAEADE